jgi:hypothetical protein
MAMADRERFLGCFDPALSSLGEGLSTANYSTDISAGLPEKYEVSGGT